MTTRTRRTPEQLAAYHQRKANQARAKAKKIAKDAKIREQIQLGKVAQAAGLSDPDDLQAHLRLAELMLEGFGAGGHIKVGGSRFHFDGLAGVFAVSEDTETQLREWWVSKKLPIGPEPDGKQP